MEKKWIFLGAIIAGILLIVLTVVSYGSTLSKKDEIVDLKILTDVEDIRVGQEVNFTVEGIDEDAILIWSFGNDTDNTAGAKVNHTFLESSYFNVTVIWEYDNEMRGKGNMTVPVKCADSYLSADHQGFIEMRPLWRRARGVAITLFPGITDPSFHVTVTIPQGTGTLGARIDLYNEDNRITLGEQTQTVIMGSVEFTFDFCPADYVTQIEDPDYLEIMAEVYQGSCSSFHVEAAAVY